MAALRYEEWMRIADEEYHRLLGLLGQLEAAEWAAPTDCEGWDVRAMVSHLAGGAQAVTSLRELLRQQRGSAAFLPGADTIDRVNAFQVSERDGWRPSELLEELAEVAPRAVRARTRMPRALRAARLPFGPPLGTKPLGYLVGRILTRDVWLHRVDLCRATGRDLVLTGDHDARLVDDVVAEWARLHGQPVALTLTGPAGGHWEQGSSGERLEFDAVEFCRILSGRAEGQGLLATRVNF
jgi:uncharacterized protein (TIGR03083 family)